MIVINSNTFDYNLDDYKEKKVALIFSKFTTTNLFKDFNIINTLEDFNKIGKRNLVNAQTFSKSLIRNNDHINSFDVLIFDLIDNQDFYFHLIFKILDLRVVKQEGNIPEVVIINHNETIEDIPLRIDEVRENKKRKGEIKLNFSKRIYRIKERDEMLSEISDKIMDIKLEEGIILVITPGPRESDILLRKLKYSKRGDLESYIVNNDISKTKFGRYKSKNTTVLIMDSNNLLPLPCKNIELIFDCYMESNYDEDKIKYSSREKLNLLKNYIWESGEINIMTTKEFYEKSPLFYPPFIPFHDLYRYYIDIVRSDKYTPQILFNGIISPEKIKYLEKTLKNLNVVKDRKILIDEEILFSIPLNFRPSLVIYKVIKAKSDLPLFPFIVLAVILNDVKSNPNNYQDPLVGYLNKWIDFSREFKNLEVGNEELRDWATLNGVNYKIFKGIVEKVIKVYEVLSKKHDIEIGIFRVENLIKKTIKFLEKVYKEFVYHRKDKIDHIYTNKAEEVKLSKIEEYKYPEQVISFNQYKNNRRGEMNKIVFFTILEE